MNRPTLVLLPGLLCDESVWLEPCRELGERVRTHVASYGRLDSIVAMAEHVLATAPTPTFSLAGHSMGGRVALEVVRRAPARVERLALLDTGFHPLALGDAGHQERARRLELLALARREGMRAMGRQWARGMVHPARIDTPLFESILDMIERKDANVFAAQIDALLSRPDAAALLPLIACPTLVLVGRDDAWSPPSQHEALAAAIPHATLTVVDDCGHMSTMEQPQAVANAFARWLDQPPRR